MIQKTKTKYENADVAYLRFMQLLSHYNIPILNNIPKHNFKHRIIMTPKIDFYCLYRKADTINGTLQQFNNLFPEFILEYPQYKGHAETANKEVICSLFKGKYYTESKEYEKEIILIFIYKDTHIYVANPFVFKKFAERHNLIRETNSSVVVHKKVIHETTYHLPFCKPFFISFEEWIKKLN